jgi:hypothetical protein
MTYRTYDPAGDSDFDLAMRAWIIEGAEGLAVYSTDALDEIRSCAASKLSCAAYSSDARLIGFEAVLDVAVDARRMGESESEEV